MYADNPKPPKQLQYAFEQGIPLVLWIGPDELEKKVVKVKVSCCGALR